MRLQLALQLVAVNVLFFDSEKGKLHKVGLVLLRPPALHLHTFKK
jgi:hypothetical protein